MKLDRTDKRLLALLQADAGQTNLRLAEQVGLSPPACLKRVRRLEDEGVIRRRVALVDPDKIGPLIHIVVEVTMERDRKVLYQQFMDRAQTQPALKQCYRVTGEVDFVMILVVPDMAAYDHFCDAVLFADPNVRKFRTLVSRFRAKFETALDVP
jgi:Lrp/AsnC family leucine-responsive transcriptional regulator